MTNRPHVERIQWDTWSREHIAKHAVSTQEVEEVVAAEVDVRQTYKERLQLVGPTLAGRMLSVVIGEVPHQPGIYYVFSARPASRKERAAYERQKGQQTP